MHICLNLPTLAQFLQATSFDFKWLFQSKYENQTIDDYRRECALEKHSTLVKLQKDHLQMF